MKNERVAPIIVLILGQFLGPGSPVFPQAARGCESLLDQADQARSTLQTVEQAPGLYRQALEVCDQSELPWKLAVRVAIRRGDLAYAYDGDKRSADRNYREALARATREGGLDHSARIEPLSELANLQSVVALGSSDPQVREKAAWESLELSREAVRVAEVAFGDGSLEASRELLLLAANELVLGPDPQVAEALARRAVEIRRRVVGSESEEVTEALSLLREILERQGKTAEAQAVLGELDELLDIVYAVGEPKSRRR